MTLISRSFVRMTALSCTLILLGILWFFHTCTPIIPAIRDRAPSLQQSNNFYKQTLHPLHGRLDLDDTQCRNTFPLLFNEIDRKIAEGQFTFHPSNPDYRGLVQARIRNNQLFILSTSPLTNPQPLHQRLSTLSQIYRALLTSPFILPNITFAFSINDVPKNNTWSFARPNKNSTYNVWPMPLFSSWSWASHDLGTMDEVISRIEEVEEELDWNEKIDKVVWRGTSWFNPLGYPNLRKDLIRQTKGQDWADVSPLDGSGATGNALAIEEFCRYKYVVYTEGVTYSGRLPYHQACESVVIMAPMTWISVSGELIRPIGGEDLMKSATARMREGRREQSQAIDQNSGTLATVGTYEDANAVYVESDFSDLEAVVVFLRDNPHVAKRIAGNQRELMVGDGYLGTTAETCYWRALIRGWASMGKVEEEEWAVLEEERYETWLLREVSKGSERTRGSLMHGIGKVVNDLEQK